MSELIGIEPASIGAIDRAVRCVFENSSSINVWYPARQTISVATCHYGCDSLVSGKGNSGVKIYNQSNEFQFCTVCRCLSGDVTICVFEESFHQKSVCLLAGS